VLAQGPNLPPAQRAKAGRQNYGPVPTKVPTVARMGSAVDHTSPYV
jgi:hypothetical protein